MTSPTSRNRLDAEESPYLRQHADNPVNWQPWDEAALEAARERDVPIFLSIGYSACHWCHVMEEESFADEEVAQVLNENFVPIKVDREERPDVDSIYMTVCQLVTGRGGWPLSAWLTPEGKPFYVGTYFPKESRQGMPGFLDLLDNIRNSWQNDREEIENRAQQWTDAATDRLEKTPDVEVAADADDTAQPGREVVESAAQAALRGADREYGGFGSDGPKFPQPSRIHALLRAHEHTGREAYLEIALETLDAMASGGLYDHVGGGFHRYCVDRDWTVPHFEKMLYDNAELPRAYLAAYQVTGDERYADVVRRTLTFVERELTHDDGGFFSTLDAQSVSVRDDTSTGSANAPTSTTGEEHDAQDSHESQREEGAFYVWTPWEVENVITDEQTAELVCHRYGITETGNFEGSTVLTIDASIGELATEFDLKPETVENRLERAREQLFEAREDRPRPPRDEKILAGWNGLMIATVAEAALVLSEEDYADTAVSALTFIEDHLWNAEENRLSRRYKDGDVAIDGYLEDYAFLASGALACYEVTGDIEHLAFALDLARSIETEFWDEEHRTVYFTPESGESLVTRPQELGDQSTPSATGVAVETLLALDHFTDEEFRSIGEAVLETHSTRVQSSPLEHVSLALDADRAETGALELTVGADELPGEWRNRIGKTYLPDRLLSRRPPTEAGLDEWLDRLDLSEAPPIWAGRTAREQEPTLYVCRSFTCSPPVHDVEEGLDWVDDLSTS